MKKQWQRLYILLIKREFYDINIENLILYFHCGHMEEGDTPWETVLREIYEECRLNVKLYNGQKQLGMCKVKWLINTQYTLLENIGQEVENTDFIYFAYTEEMDCKPQDGERNCKR